ncbi:MAG: 50S ribosomal protein L24 [Candidatus Portnoybacteria bacterium RIFCSPLOWO2_01_FULL_43_11]|uniref:Large ribosomal subunit protein uL24 n=4 Tax=Candidatus Portnoyibacteriota TaxID=1817913 RepID=A0A1G2FB81_9BACT|nr:MAG: 50S ribosomal protein L24 [Candidatus Portnoybacteria bacterium RIFCSPHIGHO2_01_FULL_40_12b]OGZ36194.1 MAG: 50S ribosomal protein L24 [Candidatus Portnoybacteria bacterium RIFCSPHIGHO2_02_FULL_40_23]OGZ38852.1 MAG: 50S ribosomal protein L24 [Candidatus Portnoybacteria bacterium RIFCSPLOWO2_01_FULL_43_11]OGZ39442.1 MAG: 50S ribosomal protein L24 [Candidatus Portnoybacteria bacterium RIFCSPHIGHO2_12_FULL_40_11]OGZ40534.1 MAG: 50S ribosomal protein L24 [Candidatus Portnoybacteria bacterium
MKIKKNDTILVITGKDRGRKAKVSEVFPKQGKITVEGVNVIKKHRRPKREGEKGQVVEIPKPIDVSNVKLVCPKCKQAGRIGYKLIEGNKYRMCRKCGQEI